MASSSESQIVSQVTPKAHFASQFGTPPTTEKKIVGFQNVDYNVIDEFITTLVYMDAKEKIVPIVIFKDKKRQESFAEAARKIELFPDQEVSFYDRDAFMNLEPLKLTNNALICKKGSSLESLKILIDKKKDTKFHLYIDYGQRLYTNELISGIQKLCEKTFYISESKNVKTWNNDSGIQVWNFPTRSNEVKPKDYNHIEIPETVWETGEAKENVSLDGSEHIFKTLAELGNRMNDEQPMVLLHRSNMDKDKQIYFLEHVRNIPDINEKWTIMACNNEGIIVYCKGATVDQFKDTLKDKANAKTEESIEEFNQDILFFKNRKVQELLTIFKELSINNIAILVHSSIVHHNSYFTKNGMFLTHLYFVVPTSTAKYRHGHIQKLFEKGQWNDHLKPTLICTDNMFDEFIGYEEADECKNGGETEKKEYKFRERKPKKYRDEPLKPEEFVEPVLYEAPTKKRKERTKEEMATRLLLKTKEQFTGKIPHDGSFLLMKYIEHEQGRIPFIFDHDELVKIGIEDPDKYSAWDSEEKILEKTPNNRYVPYWEMLRFIQYNLQL